MRDAIDPMMGASVQERPSFERVPGGGQFSANDQWVSILSLSRPLGVGISLRTNDNRILVATEPFFVSGPQGFEFLQDGEYAVTKASRRELLIASAISDGDKFGAGYSEPYTSGGIVLVAAALAPANWVYLNSNLQWTVAPIGTIASAPFGLLGSAGNDGRYYDVSMSSTSSVGSVSNFLVHRFPGGAVSSVALTGGGAANPAVSLARVGDDHTALEGTGAFSQKTLLGSGNWTIAITNNVAADVSTDLRVVRLGY